ncbi:hypothetical protein MAR_030949 [Mya arenaria]|uniref:SHSP domain-containing protein n=1 Tax=Mya arenaria TaxID=6604 RepID=A0ABY7F2G0_MYAAR|nr:hypothetical protein MAR_030949 [Mya arenaria]
MTTFESILDHTGCSCATATDMEEKRKNQIGVNESFDDSVSRFDRKLDRIRREMHDLDAEVPELQVAQPFVTDPEGNRKLSLRFNCDKFKPEEITVKTTGNVQNVHAKHEEDRTGKAVTWSSHETTRYRKKLIQKPKIHPL